MASIYGKNNVLYMSWWDWSENKTKNRSLKMADTVKNRRTANEFAKNFQKELDRKKDAALITGLVQGVTIADAFAHFKRNNAHKNEKTIDDYNRFYKKFSATFTDDSSCASITKIKVEDWLNRIKTLNFSQNTIHGYYKQLNHFLNFLFEYNYTPMFRINKDVKPRPEVKEKIIFSDEHLSLIIKSLKGKNDNFNFTVLLLFYTGLRSSDILTIEAEKIDLKNRLMSYYSPKRKKFREIAFHEKLVPVLKKAIKKKPRGRLLDYRNVENLNRAITRYFEVLKIRDNKYTARTFRKTFITLCRTRFSMDATVVKELVGHEHTNTTDRYYNQVTMEKMKEELKKFQYQIPRTKKADK
jgi:integrase